MSKSNKTESEKKLVERREFLGGAATIAGASFLGARCERCVARDFRCHSSRPSAFCPK